jgi:hypothetical protein
LTSLSCLLSGNSALRATGRANRDMLSIERAAAFHRNCKEGIWSRLFLPSLSQPRHLSDRPKLLHPLGPEAPEWKQYLAHRRQSKREQSILRLLVSGALYLCLSQERQLDKSLRHGSCPQVHRRASAGPRTCYDVCEMQRLHNLTNTEDSG